jgi:hypothetical protein
MSVRRLYAPFLALPLPGAYDREEFFDKLEAYVERAGAGAYATYELSGEFDILLRVWLHQAQATGRFADNIEPDLGLADSREFQVIEILRHWVWSGEKSHALEACDHENLRGELDIEKVEAINRLSDESHRQDTANPSTAHKSDRLRLRLRLRLSRMPRGGRFYVIGLQDPIFRQGGWDRFEFGDHFLGGLD